MEKPVILREGTYTKKDLDDLKAKPTWQFSDIFASQVNELFEVTNPSLIGSSDYKQRFEDFFNERSKNNPELAGDYIYYPWSGLLMHTVTEHETRLLRINRTRNLVTLEEQDDLAKFSAGVAGLSFGNGIALSLAYSGMANTIKIADSDIFETTNLNRVRVGLPSVNQPKTSVTAREVYEINPYADVQIFSEGLTDSNLDNFINGDPHLNIVFDVVDDFAMKIKLRLDAKKAKIPVVMLTSLEDSILVDVERYDLDPEAPVFHGLLGSVAEELLTKKMTEHDKALYAMKIVGPEHISYRNLTSLADVGTKLVSRPHLYSTVSIVCGLAAYIAKRIALGEDMPSMRKHVQFSSVLDVATSSHDTPEARNEMLAKLMNRSNE